MTVAVDNERLARLALTSNAALLDHMMGSFAWNLSHKDACGGMVWGGSLLQPWRVELGGFGAQQGFHYGDSPEAALAAAINALAIQVPSWQPLIREVVAARRKVRADAAAVVPDSDEPEPVTSREYDEQQVDEILTELARLGGNTVAAAPKLADMGYPISSASLRRWRELVQEPLPARAGTRRGGEGAGMRRLRRIPSEPEPFTDDQGTTWSTTSTATSTTSARTGTGCRPTRRIS